MKKMLASEDLRNQLLFLGKEIEEIYRQADVLLSTDTANNELLLELDRKAYELKKQYQQKEEIYLNLC